MSTFYIGSEIVTIKYLFIHLMECHTLTPSLVFKLPPWKISIINIHSQASIYEHIQIQWLSFIKTDYNENNTEKVIKIKPNHNIPELQGLPERSPWPTGQGWRPSTTTARPSWCTTSSASNDHLRTAMGSQGDHKATDATRAFLGIE